MFTQEEKNRIDFALANIEEFISRPRNSSARDNANLSVNSLRAMLDVYHMPGNPDAVNAMEMVAVLEARSGIKMTPEAYRAGEVKQNF